MFTSYHLKFSSVDYYHGSTIFHVVEESSIFKNLQSDRQEHLAKLSNNVRSDKGGSVFQIHSSKTDLCVDTNCPEICRLCLVKAEGASETDLYIRFKSHQSKCIKFYFISVETSLPSNTKKLLSVRQLPKTDTRKRTSTPVLLTNGGTISPSYSPSYVVEESVIHKKPGRVKALQTPQELCHLVV